MTRQATAKQWQAADSDAVTMPAMLAMLKRSEKAVVTLGPNEYLYPVRIFRTWLAIAMALLYLPASGYCLFEKTGLVTPVDCCAEGTSHDQEEQAPCGGYGCCPIEYAVYLSLDSGFADLVIPPADLAFLSAVLPPELPVEVPIAKLGWRPPDLPKSWQFSFRTALPPRAPSLAS
jgi:hypothetical protein